MWWIEQIEEYKEAIEIFEIVLHIFSDRMVAWINVGDIQKSLGNSMAALQSYLRYY